VSDSHQNVSPEFASWAKIARTYGQRFALILLIVSILYVAGCNQKQAEQTPTGSQNDWLAQEMATPEYATACENTSGCSDEGTAQESATEELWRVRISRAATGEIRIEPVDSVKVVAETGVPIGAVYSDLALVGLNSNGDVIDGQAIRFPDHLRIEGEAGTAHLDLTQREVDTHAYLRQSPDIARFAIQDSTGGILMDTEVPSVKKTAGIQIGPFLGIRDAKAAAKPFNGLPPHCAHVMVLEGEKDRHLATGIEFENVVKLATPGPYQLAATEAALRRMTPMLCQSVARIAFGHVPGEFGLYGAVKSSGAGDLLLINVSYLLSEASLEEKASSRILLQGTIIHEAGHAAETLLTFEGSEPGNYIGAWSFPARNLASQTIDKVRLEMGLPEEWQRLHKSFVEQDWARPFGSLPTNDPSAVPDATTTVAGGFISLGASASWAEDIAGTIGNTYMAKTVTEVYQQYAVPDSARLDIGCLLMGQYQTRNLPSHFAALYTKMRFLQDLGLLWPKDVEYCTGGKLGIPVESIGFHIKQDAKLLRSYSDKLTANLGTKESGTKVFELEAAGSATFGDSTYPANMKLQLDLGGRFAEFNKVSWPRGVYELGLLGNTNFQLRLEGAAAGDFNAMDGFVLVADSSRERITGSVFLRRAFRLHAPLPVPQTFDPPLVVRFMIEK